MATKDELLEQASDLDIEGRSTMSKGELEEAIAKAGKEPQLAEHEQAQRERGRSTGLSYREGR